MKVISLLSALVLFTEGGHAIRLASSEDLVKKTEMKALEN